ncbi:MAG: LicD family protein [Alistipes sp.]|nr:LicD family protein [Alistipes sp.]
MMDAQPFTREYNPEGSKLRQNQKELVAMLVDLAAICREHNIKWWLSSGTLLGVARHGGFIPWDDDIDITMMRRDFKRLQRILRKMDNSEYVYHSIHTDAEYTNLYGKFRKREGCALTTGKRHQYLKYRGQFIDIFSIERTSYFAAKASKVIYDTLQHPTVYIKIGWLRRLMVRIVEFMMLFIINPLLRIVGLINPRGEYHYALGMAWPKSTFYIKDILPLSTATFEGLDMPVPKDMDAYLTNVYGNWRTMPTEEAIYRSIHSVEYRDEIFGTHENN